MLTDSTHIKANTSKASEIKVMVEKESNNYMELLDHYEKSERTELEKQGIKMKRSRKSARKNAKVEKTVSKTDPEAGLYETW